jgi:hypothetical protein
MSLYNKQKKESYLMILLLNHSVIFSFSNFLIASIIDNINTYTKNSIRIFSDLSKNLSNKNELIEFCFISCVSSFIDNFI